MKTITKIKYTMFGVILCAGFAHYIYNAVTDYGLRTNKLHEMVQRKPMTHLIWEVQDHAMVK